MAEIGKLRRKRGHIKSTITSAIKALDTWQDEPNNEDYFLLKVLDDNMTKAFDKFDDLQDLIEDLDETETAARHEMQAAFNMTKARINKILHIAMNGANQLNQRPNTVNAQPSTALPTIPLPTFDGSIENWTSFLNVFSSLIDEESIPDVRKLQYLRSAVTGQAARAIESLDTNDRNYQVAMSILKDKYENTRRTLRRHWAILREYPRLSKDTPRAITNLVDTFYQHTRSLESLNAPVAHYDLPLIDLILSKVSHSTAWQWELTLSDDKLPSYKSLLKFIERRAACADNNNFESNNHKKGNQSQAFVTNKQRSANANNHTKQEATTSKPATYNNQETNANPQCPLCKEPHKLYSCQNFRDLPIEERRKLISDENLCFNCFGKAHSAMNCRSKYSCHKCHKRHNTLLHLETISPAANSAVENDRADRTNQA